MTTIVGIKAYGGKERAVVMAADLQTTRESYRGTGDMFYKVTEKIPEPFEKLMVDDKREFVFALSGTVNTPYTNRFIRRLLHSGGGEKGIDLRSRLKRKYVPEFREMNLKQCQNKSNNSIEGKHQCDALIGTRFDGDLNLYSLQPLGKADDGRQKDMDESIYISTGSGQEHARNFLRRELAKVKSVDAKNAIEIAFQAIKEATETDIYSAGSDIVVLTLGEILEFGKRIREASESAVRKELKDIKARF